MKTRPWIDVSELDSPTDPEAENAIQAASFILFTLSGQKYGGLFSITEQYSCYTTGAPTGCVWDPGVRGYWNPLISAYVYLQGPSNRSLRVVPGGQVRLRHRPVKTVTSVTIAGVTLDPSEYQLIDNAILAPIATTWDLCDMPVVTYEYGVAPPALGRIAARRLANELVLLSQGSDACALPMNVTSVSRQGVSFEIFDPQDFMDKGRTGLYEVDLFIATSNPGKAKKRPRVFSPDMPQGSRYT